MIVKEKHVTMKATKLFTLLALLMVFAVSCNKPDEPNNGGNNDSDVRVTTYTPQDICATTATCGGDVIVTQGLSLTELGVCWSTERNPSVDNSHISTRNWSEPFVCTITDLEPNTQYYVRAYALRGLEYYYGEDKNFTTLTIGGLNGHEYVDLGLPSGTLWATCNVGADKPEDYGDYFAWGETEPKTTYNGNTYKYCNANLNIGFFFTKYCNNSEYGYNGFTDNLTILQSSDDAATVNWGNNWCMPTVTQWRELYQNTTKTWTNQNGVSGSLFSSKNGAVLFLPSGGYRYNDTIKGIDQTGCYWSSSLTEMEYPGAWHFDFSSDFCDVGHKSSRFNGLSIRPVRSIK